MSEEFDVMENQVHEIAKDVFTRVHAKLKSGSVSLEHMGEYTDMVKDMAEAIEKMAKAEHFMDEHPSGESL